MYFTQDQVKVSGHISPGQSYRAPTAVGEYRRIVREVPKALAKVSE